ncbi:MAG: fumarylacetoacetate hydrolase family protein [Pseudomonadota bacterium]
MTNWVRFEHEDKIRIGVLHGDTIELYRGSLFCSPVAVDDEVPLEAVELLTPVSPKTFLGLWNNFHERAEAEGLNTPAHPLYFAKTSSCLLHDGGTIVRPQGYDGNLIYEAELGIVIGQRCYRVKELAAPDYIFGYTCVNDIGAGAWLTADDSFTQWTRAKSAPTFGPIGPVINTQFDFANARIQAIVNGEVKQDYAVADMVFSPPQIVSKVSHDMTLFPGDVIACGTSVGAGPIPSGAEVEIHIEGIGTLRNTFEG